MTDAPIRPDASTEPVDPRLHSDPTTAEPRTFRRDPGVEAAPEDLPEGHPRRRQEELLDQGVEETFPASDPVSVKRIT